MNIAPLLIAASAAVLFALGAVHLVLTYASDRFSPRDAGLTERLQWVSPKISGDITLWQASTGFHGSHSLGLMLFGAVYGYLALCQYALLLQSAFLAILGGAVLGAYLLLARLYWFAVPQAGAALALTLYLLGFGLALV